ncbi:MAG: sulfatase-like hydrolase/transferase [Chloroflexota bacterium]
MNKKPHILIFNPDQWRGDVLGHVGNQAAVTPNLDRLVQTEAVSFSRAFCQNPVCTPSRCSFMTGWYPHVRGHRTMHHMLRPDEPVLLKTLKENGYFVWWGGKNDLVPHQNGYEAYCDVKYEPEDVAERPLSPDLHSYHEWRGDPAGDNYYSFYGGEQAIPEGESVAYDRDWAMVEGAIAQIHNAPSDQPLCIYLPLGYPHPPYAVEEPWFSQIDRAKLPPRVAVPDWAASQKASILGGIADGQGLQGWTEPRWDELRATYYGMCARVDHQLGLVLAALKEAGMYEETAVFFFSDHGDFTGDYGLVEKTQNTFEDCLTRVPFVIKPPASVPVQPRVTDALVELIDFPATVEALTGIVPSHDHYGRSLLPLLAGETESHRDAVFCEGGRRHSETQAKELQSSRDPVSLYWPRLRLQQGDGPEHTKATMCRTERYKYVARLYEADELYDLESDSAELDNRIDDPALADVRQQLQARLLRFYLETVDVVPRETDQRY